MGPRSGPPGSQAALLSRVRPPQRKAVSRSTVSARPNSVDRPVCRATSTARREVGRASRTSPFCTSWVEQGTQRRHAELRIIARIFQRGSQDGDRGLLVGLSVADLGEPELGPASLGSLLAALMTHRSRSAAASRFPATSRCSPASSARRMRAAASGMGVRRKDRSAQEGRGLGRGPKRGRSRGRLEIRVQELIRFVRRQGEVAGAILGARGRLGQPTVQDLSSRQRDPRPPPIAASDG